MSEHQDAHAADRALTRAAFAALMTVYSTHEVPTGPGLPEPEPPCAAEEAIRASLAATRDKPPDQVTVEEIGKANAVLFRLGFEQFGTVMDCAAAYGRVASRLQLKTEEVCNYLQQERRVIAQLYFASRQLQPSNDQVRRLAYQVAIDARSPLVGSLRGFVPEYRDGAWRFAVHRQYLLGDAGLAPPHGYITNLSPLAGPILAFSTRTPPALTDLASWIEEVFHGQPRPEDALNPEEHRRLEYRVNGERLRLWAAGREVENINGKGEQALLRYLCANPEVSISGAKLKGLPEGRPISNPSQAADAIKKALGKAFPGAEKWLLTKPLRWAEGITIRRRS